jgi:uncharacterized protein
LQNEVNVELAIAAGFALAAFLYASVGHGDASGYLALMALLQFAPSEARPIALCMNIGVAAIAAWQFRSALRVSMLWPLCVAAIPMAYWGGLHKLSEQQYALLLGSTLFIAAWWLGLGQSSKSAGTPEICQERSLHWSLAIPMGGALGLLAGLTGIGGGVFLSPILILGRYASAKQTAAISALFIALNSSAGLLANFKSLKLLPDAAPMWIIAAVIGGTIGSKLGAKYFDERWLRRLLALVLMIASGHLLVKALG